MSSATPWPRMPSGSMPVFEIRASQLRLRLRWFAPERTHLVLFNAIAKKKRTKVRMRLPLCFVRLHRRCCKHAPVRKTESVMITDQVKALAVSTKRVLANGQKRSKQSKHFKSRILFHNAPVGCIIISNSENEICLFLFGALNHPTRVVEIGALNDPTRTVEKRCTKRPNKSGGNRCTKRPN